MSLYLEYRMFCARLLKHCVASRKVLGSVTMVSLEVFIDRNLPAALWTWGWGGGW